MNTSNNFTLNSVETTNVYLKSVHEINYLQRLKKINSRNNLYLSDNPNTVTNNNYNTTMNYNTLKNQSPMHQIKENSSKFNFD